jgi:ascorbate-specific PTS system EIIC-type component UlaA
LAVVELTPEEVEALLGITEETEGALLGGAITEIGNALIEKAGEVWVRAGQLTPLIGLILILLGAQRVPAQGVKRFF